MSQPLLQVEDITAGFGATTVLHGVSFTVPAGGIAGVFGLNGAGKSVTMKTLAGILPARSGRILLNGDDITKLSPEKRVARGMGHVPQGRQVFPQLTVEENLRLGAYTLRRRDKGRYAASLDSVYDRFPVLRQRRSQMAGTMSGGQQASLSVGRALINEPSLILIDEPSAGLSPVAQLELNEVLETVAETGVTMVLVEQNVAFGLSLVDTAHLMQTGVVVHSAPVAELDESTLATHLGIGKVLQAATGRALADRQSVPPQRSSSRAGRAS
ncbi:MAG: ABC-type branched-chain amino acid transport system, ATPase component [Frankiales bacterium]|jgi:branched-chain amino acid transport system ATP-binding protein|nr:ABC-type branched-chain amino acid transport system, ATPase component [Frankiales bacterium]